MEEGTNRPIFVVGSPRSGTSILTWCLGQHPNIFPVPESNWMGDFAINIAIGYQIGAARGERSILSAMEIREDELFAALGRSIHELILSHRADLERKRQGAVTAWGAKGRWFQARRSSSDPKNRWVDGTPEYSMYICGLRKLFPDARFIHIFRDVGAVVRSMLNFRRVAGTELVSDEESAYKYWLRTVKACVQAEQAYGPNAVCRVRYTDLVDSPEPAMRSVLDFLEEPYDPKCLEPLAQRINSSEVPVDFEFDGQAADPAIVEKATRLCASVNETAQPRQGSCAAAHEMETTFRERVKYMAAIDGAYQKTQQIIKALNRSGLPLYLITHAALAIADPCATVLSQLS